MSWWSRLSGPSKEDIIRTLIKRRILETGILDEFSRDVDSLNSAQLYGTPEATILVIVETYAMLKKRDTQDGEIFARIEAHRASAGTGQLPQPLTLESYVAYRIALEHSAGAPISQDFIAEAVAVCRAFFHCPGGPQAASPENDIADNEQYARLVQRGPPQDAPATAFMAAMPHPEADTPVRRLRFKQEHVNIEYYENPRTVGTVEAGISQPYESPQVAVIIEQGRPVLIVRTERSARGALLLCTLDPSGTHTNYGPFEPRSQAPRDDEFIRRAIEVFRSVKRR